MSKKDSILGDRLKELRNKKGINQEHVAIDIGISRARYSHYENNHVEPDIEILRKLASYYDVTTDYLLGHSNDLKPFNKKLPELTNKDEKDIAKDLENIINNISTNGYAHFDGRSMEDLDEDDKELLKASLENSMRLAKRLAKDKFTPKKYKKE